MPKKPRKSHLTEKRTREIQESYCADKKCKFFGKPAQQGVCHTTETFAGGPWAYIEFGEKQVAEGMAWFKKAYKGREYVRTIEAYLESSMMNNYCVLDELIQLRKENALLKLVKK